MKVVFNEKTCPKSNAFIMKRLDAIREVALNSEDSLQKGVELMRADLPLHYAELERNGETQGVSLSEYIDQFEKETQRYLERQKRLDAELERLKATLSSLAMMAAVENKLAEKYPAKIREMAFNQDTTPKSSDIVLKMLDDLMEEIKPKVQTLTTDLERVTYAGKVLVERAPEFYAVYEKNNETQGLTLEEFTTCQEYATDRHRYLIIAMQ